MYKLWVGYCGIFLCIIVDIYVFIIMFNDCLYGIFDVVYFIFGIIISIGGILLG
jgi:hypothetical protein